MSTMILPSIDKNKKICEDVCNNGLNCGIIK